ncbi:flippase [Natronobacterium gregoryi]|uniref:Flippase n=2 Tax=Natronobacterium gregoryi TaxID=44930 RepID=L0ADU5_NATGS|nr:flippase [Natronobacterium gregoryi]AFZ72078.1 membrane protein involved in the export of O-antigen and teichoic acid [Natronobacterium gregoryi SP2]ELY62748.1 polysaccharide biosynthesis protein [Natronobacterium gregoryi SP2]PLK20052.1 flippase [Natronobacterium gregoryi SP2]SFJ44372.1 Membrane protein involved in the export of O-antigen and teichoic acid [Natronobacterium gregoryi]
MTDHDDDGVSTLAKQGSITFVGNVINGVLGFAIVVLMTRFVSPSVYGLFVLATSVILFMQVFANLGLPLAIDYFVPQYLEADERGKAKGVILQVTATVLVTSSLVAFALAVSAATVSAFFQEPAMEIALLLLSVTIPMLAIYNVLLTSYYSIKKLQYRVIMRDLVRPIVRFTVTAGLLLVGYGLLGLIVGYVVGLAVAITVGAIVFTYKAWDLLATDVELVPARPLVAYSVPLAMTSVVFVLMGHVDYFVLGYFLSSDDVGIYRVGYMLGSGLMIIFNSLSPVFKPLIAEKRDDIELVQSRFRTMVRWIAGITLPIAIVLSLGASSYLAVLYTPQYAEASAVVVLLAGAFLFNVTFGGPDGSLLQGLGYSRMVFVNTLVLFGANFVLSMALVPIFGIEGAAIGSATALFLVGTLTLVEIYHLDGIHPFTRDFAKIVGAGVPATIAGVPVVSLIESDVAIVVALPVVIIGVYLLALLVTDAFTEEDARMLGEFSPRLEEWLPVR